MRNAADSILDNTYEAMWEYANGISAVASIPPVLQIARSNICNFKCVYCADHRAGNTVARTKNDGETWEMLSKLLPRAELLSFHGISEFMIDPQFFEIITACAQSGANISINTNGSVWTKKYEQVLKDFPGRLIMTFSLDAAGPASYLRMRGGDFHSTLENVKKYVQAFSQRRDRTWLSASFVITRSNLDEILPFIRLASRLGFDSVRFHRLLDYESLDWRIKAKDGSEFDYQQELPKLSAEKYNTIIEQAHGLADELAIYAEIPAKFEVE